MPDSYGEALSFLREARSIPSIPELEGRFTGVAAQFGFNRTYCVLMAEPGRPIRPTGIAWRRARNWRSPAFTMHFVREGQWR